MNRATAFVPHALPAESAGSVMLRLSQAHTELPSSFFYEMGYRNTLIHNVVRDATAGKRTILREFADFNNWEISEHTKYAALSRKGEQWMAFKNPKLCVDCAKEGFLPETHDYHLITCCTKHKRRLLTHCSHCGDSLRWNRFGLARCHCFQEIQHNAEATEAEIELNRRLEKWIVSNEGAMLTAFSELVGTLLKRVNPNEEWELPVADFISGNLAPLANKLKPYQQSMIPLNGRALVAPLSQISSKVVRLALPSLASAIDANSSAEIETPYPKGFYLTRSELLFAFGCKPDTIDALLLNGLKNSPLPGSTRKCAVRLPELQKLYALYDSPPKEGAKVITLGQLSAISKSKVWQLLLDVLSGKLIAAGATSWRLSDLQVVTPDDYLDEVPEGFSTIESAKEILGLNAAYFAGFRKSGLLGEYKQANKNNRWLYKTAELYDFRERYACAVELSKLTQTPATEVTERLRQNGIYPVSGPGIDFSKVFVFRRDDLSNLNIAEAVKELNGKSSAGRRSSSAPTLDTSVWVSSANAASILNVSDQQFAQLVDKGLIHTTKAEYSLANEHNHVKRSELNALRLYLQKLRSVDDIAKQYGVSSRQVLTRLYRLCKKRPLKINNQEMIGPTECVELEYHFKNYWDASQVARYLNSSRADVHNWKRLGYLPAINSSEQGFIEQPTLFKRNIVENFRRPNRVYAAN